MRAIRIALLIATISSPGCQVITTSTSSRSADQRPTYRSVSLDARRATARQASTKPSEQANYAADSMPVEPAVSIPATSPDSSRRNVDTVDYVDNLPQKQASKDRPRRLQSISASESFAYDLDSLEKLAVENNPGIREAIAQVVSLEGKKVQVGLRPNPIVGYSSADVGEEGTAGQQGAYVSQTFIRGGKLPLNRSIVDQEIMAAEANVEIVRQSLLVEVRQRYYDLLVAQEKMQVVSQFRNQFEKLAKISQVRFDEKEISQVANAQTQLQVRNVELLEGRTREELQGAQQRLAAVVFANQPFQQNLEVAGQLKFDELSVDQEAILDSIMENSPELTQAYFELERANWNLRRQLVEPIRDVQAQATVTHGNVTSDDLVALQIGVPLLINDRNQGNIAQARAEVTAAHENIQHIEQDLSKRFAVAWRDYQVNRTQYEQFQSNILPAARETLEMVEFAFQEGEIGYLDLINAQQVYLRSSLDFLDVTRDRWRAINLLEGNLLGQ